MENYLNIIILNWNGSDYTIDCLNSIILNDFKKLNVIVVDNNSNINDVKKIELFCLKTFENFDIYEEDDIDKCRIRIEDFYYRKNIHKLKVILVKNRDNLGFANGNNVALKYLYANGQTMAMLLNNDTVIKRDSLKRIVDFSNSHPKIVAITPQIRYFDPNNIVWNCGGFISFLGHQTYLYGGENIDKVPKYGYRLVDYATGCALFLKLQETNILSERFYFGEEDLELCLRLKKEHKQIAVLFDSIIFHRVGGSHKKIGEKNIGKMIMFYTVRLANLKSYYNSYHWFFILLAYVFGSMNNICIRNKYTLLMYFKIWKKIFVLLSQNRNFDKNLFFEVINLKL